MKRPALQQPLVWTVAIFLSLAVGQPATVFADAFDRHTSYWLKQATKESKPLAELSLDRAIRLKTLAANVGNPCIVVKTNDGNWAKALVGWGFRKGKDKPVPVLLIERFVTYRGDRGDVSAASGQDIMLFAGFSFNFDIGQVVPAGQGADIEFTDKSILKPVGNAEVYGIDGSQLPAPAKDSKPDPNDHDGVLPRDFSGTWLVNVDGRWRGRWDLTVDDNRQAYGKYTSDETKSSYKIKGKIAALPHNIRLDLELANSQQKVDAYLWTKDKSTLAGTVTVAGRKFGFFAVRQKASSGGQ